MGSPFFCRGAFRLCGLKIDPPNWLFSHSKNIAFYYCNPPDLLQESLGPFGPEVSRECPSGCLWRPFGPRAPKCPKSVPRVSPECQKGVPDTLGTLRGHSRDTFWAHSGARGPKGPETPRGTLPDTSGLKGPRDSCSRSGGLQGNYPIFGWTKKYCKAEAKSPLTSVEIAPSFFTQFVTEIVLA